MQVDVVLIDCYFARQVYLVYDGGAFANKEQLGEHLRTLIKSEECRIGKLQNVEVGNSLNA